MQYKALVTRMLTMADEAIEIIISDTDTFQDFSTKVESALALCDKRANTQMFMLFEDTSLTDALSVEEYVKAEYAANILYPDTSLYTTSLGLGENVQIAFTKTLPSGEAVKVFLHDTHTYEEVIQAVEDIWNLIDNRLVETNDREIGCNKYLNSLDPELKIKISMILDILYGRMTPQEVISRLKEQETGELPNGVYIQRNTE